MSDLYLNQWSTFLTYSSQEERNVGAVLVAPRKQKEPSKEKEAPEDTDTEVEGSDEEQHKSETGPWPLKCEKRITGRKTPRSSAEPSKQKHITPKPFEGEVPLQEHLVHSWNGWTDQQKAQQLFMCLRGRARGAIQQKDEWKYVTYQELVKHLEAMFSGQAELCNSLCRHVDLYNVDFM